MVVSVQPQPLSFDVTLVGQARGWTIVPQTFSMIIRFDVLVVHVLPAQSAVERLPLGDVEETFRIASPNLGEALG